MIIIKKYRLFISLACFFLFCTFSICNAQNNISTESILPLNYDEIVQIDINAGGPMLSDHQKYNYTTSSKNEIIYILKYIHSFNLKNDGKIIYANDGPSYLIKIHMNDRSVKEYGFYMGRFYDDTNKQYAINSKEYLDFLQFINALKTKKIVLNEKVTFEPSEWAKNYVDKAVSDGLVPKFNQINYKGKINRLEVCQLIDNLLTKKNYSAKESGKNPFSDTANLNVINLYNYGIINGKTDTEFYPYDYITREEFSRVLANTHILIYKEKQCENINNNQYIDSNEISDWAKESIKLVSEKGILIGDSLGRFRPKDCLTKQEAIISLVRLS